MAKGAKIKHVKLEGVTNGYKIRYEEYMDRKGGDDPYQNQTYLGEREEVFKANEADIAMARFQTLLGTSGVTEAAEQVTITTGD